MTAASLTNVGPPAQIYIVRHGEKPTDPTTPTAAPSPPFGIDVNGNESIHSLLPRGWQRSGALAVLFAPALGPPQASLRTPMTLFSPDYGEPDKTQGHRTYETIQALSGRLKVPINSAALPTVSGTQIPAAWPGDRFDLIWSFSLQAGASSTAYVFSQIPQQVLSGDSPTLAPLTA